MRISDWSSDASRAALPAQGFDLLFSRFGVMFFDDPAAAFAHLREALKAGGRLAFVCWRAAAENDWVRLPMGARSEEHTSELQSLMRISYAVFCLKKKNNRTQT